MKSRLFSLFLLAAIFLSQSSAVFAHFLWIINDNGTLQVYFSESCEPGEPQILSKAATAKAWAVSKNSRSEKPIQDIVIALANGQLSGKLPENVGVMGLSQDYGVLTRGEQSFMLRYYAKGYASNLPTEWKELNNPEKLALEITPKWEGKELHLRVIWKGQPLKDGEVTIDGCGIEHEVLKTNEAGVVVCKPTKNGVLSARAKQEEKGEGELDEKLFTSIRSYSTLSLPLQMPKVTSIATSLPELDKGITSFGAAIAGDDLYVYGGHFGSAHHYSIEGQSGELKRVSLKADKGNWESLPEGPKLTGLALVTHNGKLYRVGGFTAKNEEKAEQDLESQSSFAVYDPATKKWTDLAPLPEGRSSHDAAVLDGKLYVVGGWKLGGKEPTVWHKSALVCDLNKENPTWEEIASPPFTRRALSVAAFDGKIYVVGGMQEKGGIAMNVDTYDPKTNAWTAGPAILGSGMDGFGTSCFANKDALVVTTMSGAIQQLVPGANAWELVGQLQSPRFFHRELATAEGDLLVVGGASMETGKVNSVERFKIEK